MSNNKPQPSNLVKHSSIYAIGNLARQLAAFIMLPVYTRYLSPADYGVVGLLALSMSIIEPFLGARLGNAIPKFYYAETEPFRRNLVVSTAFIVTASISFTTVLILFFLRDSISNSLFGSLEYGTAVGFFSFLFLTQALEYYGLTFIRMQQKPKLFLLLSLTKLLIQISLNIALIVFLKLGVMGMVISNVASSLPLCIFVTGYALSHSGYKLDFNLAKVLLRFAAPLWLSGLAMLYINCSNRYFIRFFGSIDQVGLYELAARLGGIVMLIVWSPFYLYWETEQFKIHKNIDAKKTFENTFALIFIAMAIVSNGLSLFSTPVIAVMASHKFYDASLAVPFITISHLFSSLAIFVSFGFMASGKTNWIGRINLAAAALVTILNAALIPKFGFVGAAVALMLAFVAQFIASNNFSKQFFSMENKIYPIFFSVIVIGIARWIQSFSSFEKHFFISLAYTSVIFILSSAAIAATYYRSAENKRLLLTNISAQLRNRVPKTKGLCEIIDRYAAQLRS